MGCVLQEESIFQQGGEFYRLVEPLSYRENTSSNPGKSGQACIGGDALNEACRRVVPATNTLASGLRLDVVRDCHRMWFHDVVVAGLRVGVWTLAGD